MKSKHFRWLFLALIAAIFYGLNRDSAVAIGATLESSEGRYFFAGGTSPSALVVSLIVIGCYALLLASKPGEEGDPLPSVFRRFISFWLDFVVALSAIGPILGLIPTLWEWRRTGVFHWNFLRMEPAPGDGWIVIASVILAFASLAFYFALPLVWQRPTPGSCIIGYRVTPDYNRPLSLGKALKRTALGFIAVCSLRRAFSGERRPQEGKFWLDMKFKTRAVKLK